MIPNGALKGHVAIPVSATKRVAAQPEQLEDHHGERKCIVIPGPDDILQGTALDFWCGIFWFAHLADEAATPMFYLERVCIDKSNAAFLRDQNPRFIHVTDHAPRLVNIGNRLRNVEGDMDEELIIGIGKVELTSNRLVELMQRLRLCDPLHQEAGKSSLGVKH